MKDSLEMIRLPAHIVGNHMFLVNLPCHEYFSLVDGNLNSNVFDTLTTKNRTYRKEDFSCRRFQGKRKKSIVKGENENKIHKYSSNLFILCVIVIFGYVQLSALTYGSSQHSHSKHVSHV